MYETELRISGLGLPPFSSRNCRQTLTPIAKKLCHRTINGRLIYTGKSTHHKYRSTIQGDDQTVPGLSQLWVGSDVSVSCIQVIWENLLPANDALFHPTKPFVPGTLRAYTLDGQEISVVEIGTDALRIEPIEDSVRVCYCPVLQMKLVNFDFSVQEWAQSSHWSLEFEEV